MPVAAVRLCLDRGRQYPGRGRAMGEARDDGRGRPRRLGRIVTKGSGRIPIQAQSPTSQLEETMIARSKWRGVVASFFAAAALTLLAAPAGAQAPSGEPVKIGFSM